eukprot:TRINITY_DN2934_c0_g1_i1.p1 TRINITY_DN2934_c0_g1~~TRINITY_DN2934_c0_g1_i1.p1  ORF type:complete len:487 (+),score=169.89 TRINITY_DN2934_c0_g1_i1:1450-2910(+)
MFTVFCGLEDCIKFIEGFKFSETDIKYLKEQFPEETEEEFFEYLANLDCSEVKMEAVPEGSLVFPAVPLLRLEGPLAVIQLLETTLLNLVNYPSLVATNAARMRKAAGDKAVLLEMGLRRAQGPNGAMSASKYCVIGGFNSTSNVLAGKLYGLPIKGTQAHSFVTSFRSLDDLKKTTIRNPVKGEEPVEFVEDVLALRESYGWQTNDGELAAFVAYAQAFPSGFLALIDSYDTLRSGVLNFLCVAIPLAKLGYKPVGVRLDSGDLAFLSRQVRQQIDSVNEKHDNLLGEIVIVASDDIDELKLMSLNDNHHQINIFGVGTHLVTCKAQPALGCVFKLVEVNGEPRIKLSNTLSKVTIPGKKDTYRLSSKEGYPIVDLLVPADNEEEIPQVGQAHLCRHPFVEGKRAYVKSSKVEKLHELVWDGKRCVQEKSLLEIREHCQSQLNLFPENMFCPPGQGKTHKISVSDSLYTITHDCWLKEQPIELLL